MSDPVGVSVIVPVLNGEHTLPSLLSGLRSQLPHRFGGTEILIVDNGSTDATRAVVEGAQVPNLTLLDETKRGPSAARNRGLGVARGSVVALLDADCVPTRGWLRALVDPFADPSVVIAAGGLASYPPKTGAQRFAARYGLNEASRAVYNPWFPFANTRNMAVRRDAAVAVGGWPEDLTFGEDIEFSLLIQRRFRCHIAYHKDALAFHQDRESDEELVGQAYSYGFGASILFRRHPEEAAWTLRYRLHRRRRSTQRWLSAKIAGIGRRLGRVAAEEAEFAHYLLMWDRAFWRGFFDGMRPSASQARP